MAVSRERKSEQLDALLELLDQSDGFVIVESAGLTVKDVTSLRRKVRDAKGRYVVSKNTLMTKALESRGWPVPEKLLKGPVAVVFGLDNFPGVAKAVLEYVAEPAIAEKIRLKGGVVGTDVVDAAGVDMVSKLPSLDELRAQLAGLIVQPASGLVGVINAATGQVVNVIHAYVQDRGGEDAA